MELRAKRQERAMMYKNDSCQDSKRLDDRCNMPLSLGLCDMIGVLYYEGPVEQREETRNQNAYNETPPSSSGPKTMLKQ
jgi:hypothetical protein